MTPECTCGHEGPDYFGNYDQLENPDCVIHGEVGRVACAIADSLGQEGPRRQDFVAAMAAMRARA